MEGESRWLTEVGRLHPTHRESTRTPPPYTKRPRNRKNSTGRLNGIKLSSFEPSNTSEALKTKNVKRKFEVSWAGRSIQAKTGGTYREIVRHQIINSARS